MTDINGLIIRAAGASLRPSSWNPTERTFDIVIATPTPVERADARGAFDEILNTAGATWADKVPVQDSHRRGSIDDQLGEAFNIRREGNEIVATVRLSAHSPKAQRIAAELSDGVTFQASIGYRARYAEGKQGGRRTKTAAAFTIDEVSLVTFPADPSATIRSSENMTTTVTRENTATFNAEVRSIAKSAGLDDTWANQHIDDATATLDTVRAAALAAMIERTSSTTANIRNIRVGVDHNDPEQIRSAMSDALAHRIAPGAVKLEGRATEFRSHRVLDMVGDLAASRGDSFNIRDQEALMQRAVGAHATSDFPNLLSNAANKALLAQYQIEAPSYRKWAARKPFSSFKEHSFLRIGDFPAFKPVRENGNFKYGSISESAESVKAKAYGTGIAIGREALANDDLAQLSDFSAQVAIRAANDENALAYGVLLANATLKTDGKTLFHADHNNKAASGTALDAANLTIAVKALRGQKSLDGMPLNLQPAFLIVGPALEVSARQLLAAVNATKTSDVNVWANFAELVVDANISDNAWYIAASPAAAPSVVYGYVDGQGEGPVIRSTVDFDNLALKVAADLVFAVGAVDFRGIYQNSGQ